MVFVAVSVPETLRKTVSIGLRRFKSRRQSPKTCDDVFFVCRRGEGMLSIEYHAHAEETLRSSLVSDGVVHSVEPSPPSPSPTWQRSRTGTRLFEKTCKTHQGKRMRNSTIILFLIFSVPKN